MIYFDNAATTRPLDDVLQTYDTVNRKYFYNTASLSKGGQEARKLLEASRTQIKQLFKLNDYDLLFTSGATESNNIVIQSVIKKKKQFGRTVLVSELEHPSVIEVLRHIDGIELVFIDTTPEGIIDIKDLKEKMSDDVIFVSVIAVNNIIGSIQPIEKIVDVIKQYNRAFLHVDATQAVGKVNIDYRGVDAVSFSAHKFYGVKGVGGLFVKNIAQLNPVMYGGGHEYNVRSGTVNLPGIASTAKALRLSFETMDDTYNKLNSFNDKIREALRQYEGVYIQPKHVPHYINLSITGAKGEVIVNALSKRDIYVSTTSACASQRNAPNETLIAMGNPLRVIEGSIRLTMGQYTTESEIDTFIKVFDEIYKELGDVIVEI